MNKSEWEKAFLSSPSAETWGLWAPPGGDEAPLRWRSWARSSSGHCSRGALGSGISVGLCLFSSPLAAAVCRWPWFVPWAYTPTQRKKKRPSWQLYCSHLKSLLVLFWFFFVFENGCFPLTKFALLFMCRLDLFALLPSLLWTSKLLSGGPTLVLNVLINFHLKLLPCFSVSPGPASAQGLKDIAWSFQTGGGFKKSNTAFQCWERNVCLPFAAQYMNLPHFEFWLCIDVFFV